MNNEFRSVAVESLKKIDLKNAYSNIVINNDVRKIKDKKYHALYRRTILGVIENRIFIDWVINLYSKASTKKMQIELLEILRLAVYQIYFQDDNNEKKIVNESVEVIKERISVKASKFTNAVIRNIIRNKDKTDNELKKLDFINYNSIKYSYPIWMIERWINEFGKDKLKDVLEANNAKPFLNIRVNTLKISKKDLTKRLEEKGLNVRETKFSNEGLSLINPNKIEEIEEFKKGYFSIQSESSMLVNQILKPKIDSFLIDMCAAPGGKSFHAAEMMENKGTIISRDLYKNKIKIIENEKKRLGINIINSSVYDALVYDETLYMKADYCIVDVPCSGLGIIRRKPEIKYRKKLEDINILKKIQYKIIKNASKYLKSGGELVYSTCTTNKEENINIVKEFVKNNKDFTLVDIDEETNHLFETAKKGYIEIFPHIHNIDGFFIAKLRKN